MERPRYIVRLSTEERAELESIVKKGKGGAHKIRAAQILLLNIVPHCTANTIHEVLKKTNLSLTSRNAG